MTRCHFENCDERVKMICIDCYNGFCEKHIEHDHFKLGVGQ